MLSPRRAEEMIGHLGFQLTEAGRRTDAALSAVSERSQARFDRTASRIDPRHMESYIEMGHKNVDAGFARAGALLSGKSAECRSKLDAIGARPETAVKGALNMKGSRLAGLSRNLEGVSPLNVLNRGYGLVTTEDGAVIMSASSMGVGDKVRIRMRDGAVAARIENKEEKE